MGCICLSALLVKRHSDRLLAVVDLDVATSEGLVSAVIVNDHFAAAFVPDPDAEGVIASRVKVLCPEHELVASARPSVTVYRA